MTRWKNYATVRRKNQAVVKTETKYHSKKITLDGQEFQSKREAKRWAELWYLQRAGQISGLERQVKFVLIPAQREPDTIGKRGGVKKGKLLEREVAYFADFVYQDLKTGELVVEDTKGIRTTEYIIKRKLMLYVHHIKIHEI